MLTGILALLVAAASPLQPVVPRPVVQLGHDSPVRAVAWLPDPHFILSVSATEAIIWNADTGEELDYMAMPPPKAGRAVTVVGVRIDPGATAAAISAFVWDALEDSPALAFCSVYHLDLTARRIEVASDTKHAVAAEHQRQADAFMAERQRNPAAKYDGGPYTNLSDCAGPRGPDPNARGRTARITPHDIVLSAGDAPPVHLRDAATDIFKRGYLSPDASLVAYLRHDDTGTTIEVRATATGQLLPRTTWDTSLARLYWTRPSTYVAAPAFSDASESNCSINDGFAMNAHHALFVDAQTGVPQARPPAFNAFSPLGVNGESMTLIPSNCLKSPNNMLMIAGSDGAAKSLSIAGITDHQIYGFAASPSGHLVAVTMGPEGADPKNLPDGVAIALISGDLAKGTGTSVTLLKGLGRVLQSEGMGFARDNSRLVAVFDEVANIWDTATGQLIVTIPLDAPPTFISADHDFLVVGNVQRPDMKVYRIDKTGALVATIKAHRFIDGGLLPGRHTLWTAAEGGAIRLYDTRTWQRVLTMFRAGSDGFVAIDAAGRYDTDLSFGTSALRWLVPDRPWQGLAAQTFMQDYYRPQLVALTLACLKVGNCATALPPPRDVGSLNRILPKVEIAGFKPVKGTDLVDVTVVVANGHDGDTGVFVKDTRAFRDAKFDAPGSGVHDLRLFRDNKLVAQFPDPGTGIAAPKEITAWRKATEVLKPGDKLPRRITLRARLPAGVPYAAFSAYAFNNDRAKGATVLSSYALPAPLPPRPPRAVVLAIGVNVAREPQWRLNYAVADAASVTKALGAIPGYAVSTISLISDGTTDTASKAIIRAVLLSLGGEAGKAEQALIAKAGIAPASVAPVLPGDAVIIAFSGHGDTIGGQFYLLPSDGVALANTDPDPATMISSAELTAWLRHVDASEMAMIIDACHSAAAADSGDFRPGPMGDPGLGQLAFDKGIRILAATQADKTALEQASTGHGLLTHVLIDEGLGPKSGAVHDGQIMLDDWLRFAVARLPLAAREAGKARSFKRFDPAPEATPQQPSLFDFNPAGTGILLRRVSP